MVRRITRKAWLRRLILIGWTSALVYNGVVIGVALYTEVGGQTTARGWERLQVGYEYFAQDFPLGWKIQPDLKIFLKHLGSDDKTLFFSSNQDGLRSSTLDEGRSLIILLGDSYVQGYYLYDHETIGARLSFLAEANVINAGVGGYSTDQQYLLLTQLLQVGNQPAWVVLLFFPNDLEYLEKSQAWGMRKPYFESSEGEIDFSHVVFISVATGDYVDGFGANDQREVELCCTYELLNSLKEKIATACSHFPQPFETIRVLQEQIANVKFGHFAYQLPELFYRDPESYEEQWDRFFQFATKINENGQREDYRLLMVFVPELAQVTAAEKDHFEPQRYFLSGCAERQLDCLDPHVDFIERQQETDLFFMDDGHFSPAGAEFLAGIIHRHLESK